MLKFINMVYSIAIVKVEEWYLLLFRMKTLFWSLLHSTGVNRFYENYFFAYCLNVNRKTKFVTKQCRCNAYLAELYNLKMRRTKIEETLGRRVDVNRIKMQCTFRTNKHLFLQNIYKIQFSSSRKYVTIYQVWFTVEIIF